MRNSRKSLKKVIREIDPLSRDLSDLLARGTWQSVRFELKPKNKVVTIRMSEELLKAVKETAREKGLDYQKFIRIALEQLTQKY